MHRHKCISAAQQEVIKFLNININNLKEENIDILIVICGSCDITSLDLVSNNKITLHNQAQNIGNELINLCEAAAI